MKLHYLAISLFIFSISQGEELPYDQAALKYAIMGKESSFGKDKRDGDKGLAIGPYQIRHIAVKDVNKYYGTLFTHEDCRDYTKGWEIALLYMRLWALESRLGHKPTVKDMALSFHYGPVYSANKNYGDPDNYWQDVRETYIKLINHKTAIITKS